MTIKSTDHKCLYTLCAQCSKRSLFGVNTVFRHYPRLNDIFKETQNVIYWIYFYRPSKDILVYLYQEKQMSIMYNDANYYVDTSHEHYIRARNQCDFLSVLVMSAPILELKDFVMYLSDIITK